MAQTRAPRRLQDPALAAYLQLLAQQIKEERRPTAQKTIAEGMGLDPAQFTHALRGTTASSDVLFAFAKYRGITAEEVKERASAWYRANRLEVAADDAWARCESESEIDEVCRLIRARARASAAAEPAGDGDPNTSDD